MNGAGDASWRAPGALAGSRVLVLEDPYLLATELARALRSQDAEVVGPAPTLEAATRLAALDSVGERLDGALLNVNIRGEMVYPLADALLSRAVPVVFVTGYDAVTLPEHYAGISCCQKPVRPEAVLRALLLHRARLSGDLRISASGR